MSPVAASPISRKSRSYARVQAKLAVRPEETVPRDPAGGALHRLDTTIQVKKAVWSQLVGSDAPIDTQSTCMWMPIRSIQIDRRKTKRIVDLLHSFPAEWGFSGGACLPAIDQPPQDEDFFFFFFFLLAVTRLVVD